MCTRIMYTASSFVVIRELKYEHVHLINTTGTYLFILVVVVWEESEKRFRCALHFSMRMVNTSFGKRETFPRNRFITTCGVRSLFFGFSHL